MITETLKASCEITPSERRNSRRYTREVLGAAVIYVALTFLSVWLVEHAGAPAKYFVALMPVLGSLLMIAAIVRYARRLDELQRQSIIGAAVVALIFTITVTLALGFLENAGVPRVGMEWVWPIAVISWGIALPFVRRKYR
jgi:hypothetical protein